MSPQTPRSPSSLARALGPTGLLGLAWTAAPAVCGTLLLASLAPVSEWLLYHRPVGLALYTVVFVLGAGLGFLPTYAQSILGGWVFGVAAGLPAALLGFTGGGGLGYAVARRVSKDRVEALIERNEKARAIRDALVGRGPLRTFLVVVLLRLPPNSPFALTNLVMATTGVPLPAFLAGTLLGMVPRTAVAVSLAAAASATGAEDIQTFVRHRGPLLLVAGVVGGVAVLGVLGAIARSALRRVTARGPGPRPRGAPPEKS
jgi:uncharacterized membrane protein YdjX (TVP38/TMEM64 family)